jgi:ribosomal protein S18 acetylase RimI-like enzyme
LSAQVRPLVADDVDAAAEADFAAFLDIAARHGQPPVVTAVRDARANLRRLLAADPLGGFVAEEDGHVVGHAWVHARGPIATVGPIAVEPGRQGHGTGRALLARCLEAAGPRATQVRLVQESVNLRALALYLRAGFRVVAPVVELELRAGAPVGLVECPPGVELRGADRDDRARIVARDARAFGTSRPNDVGRALDAGRGVVALRGGTLVGYALGVPGRLGSAAADDADVVLAMLSALAAEPALGRVPLRAMILATDRRLVDGLMAIGFALFRSCQYMVRGGGTAPSGGYVLMGGDFM